MTHIILLGTLVVYELRIFFIQRKVCEMSVLGIFTCRWIVLINSKPSKTFVVHVDAPGVNTGYHHVNSQVKLKTVYQKGVCDVFTDYALLIYRDFRYVVYLRKVINDLAYDVDSLALA